MQKRFFVYFIHFFHSFFLLSSHAKRSHRGSSRVILPNFIPRAFYQKFSRIWRGSAVGGRGWRCCAINESESIRGEATRREEHRKLGEPGDFIAILNRESIEMHSEVGFCLWLLNLLEVWEYTFCGKNNALKMSRRSAEIVGSISASKLLIGDRKPRMRMRKM